MRISALPAEVRYVLREHTVEQEGEEGAAPAPPVPVEGAPVFVYRPLDPREKSQWMTKLFGDVENVLTNVRYLDLFEERLVRIDNLFVGPEGSEVPFDKAKHLNDIPLEWQTEVALNVISRSRLSEDDAGK